MKRYFDNEDDGFCYSISHFKECLTDANETEMFLWEAVIEKGQDHFFCSHYQEVGLKGETECGKMCDGYKPRNGVNGRCKFHKNTYFPGDKFILTKKGEQFKLMKINDQQ